LIRRIIDLIRRLWSIQIHIPEPLNSNFYPSIERVRCELGLESWVSLEEAIERTARWVLVR